jgi:hypothetical protein
MLKFLSLKLYFSDIPVQMYAMSYNQEMNLSEPSGPWQKTFSVTSRATGQM